MGQGRGTEHAPAPAQEDEGGPLGDVRPVVGRVLAHGARPERGLVRVHGDEERDGLGADEDREHGEREGREAEPARDERGLVDVCVLCATGGRSRMSGCSIEQQGDYAPCARRDG